MTTVAHCTKLKYDLRREGGGGVVGGGSVQFGLNFSILLHRYTISLRIIPQKTATCKTENKLNCIHIYFM
jgi:hypothetical protein